nr:MAG TPA: hypothetical protein [Caudoviricetes sp.]
MTWAWKRKEKQIMLLRTLLDVTDACQEVKIPLELLNHDVIAVKPLSKKKILLVVSDK